MFVLMPDEWKKNTFKKKIDIEGILGKLYYRVTVTFLLVSTAVVWNQQYFGAYIKCTDSTKEPPVDWIETVCFINGTYTLINIKSSSSEHLVESVAPGTKAHEQGDIILYHEYYKWVPLILLIQAVFFCAPHYFRKYCDDGFVIKMVDGLQNVFLTTKNDDDYSIKNGDTEMTIPSEKSISDKISFIVHQYMDIVNYRTQRSWGWMLVICESTHLVNILMQIWLIHVFLGNKFLQLGLSIIYEQTKFSFLNIPINEQIPFQSLITPNANVSYLDILFPKVTKCTIHTYGPTGSIVNRDLVCVLAMNILNEIIFTIMWFLFLILLVASLINVAYRITQIILYKNVAFNRFLMGKELYELVNFERLSRLLDFQQSYSDWILLRYLGTNMETKLHAQLLREICTLALTQKVEEESSKDR